MQAVGLSRYLLSRALFMALVTALVAWPLFQAWLLPIAQDEVGARQQLLTRALAAQLGAKLEWPTHAPLTPDQALAAEVNHALHEAGLSASLRAFVLDRNGESLYDSGARTAEDSASRPANLPPLNDATDGAWHVAELDGLPVLGTLAAIPHTGWTLLLTQPRDEAFRTLRIATAIVAIVLLTAVSLSLLGALLQARGFVKQFRTLRSFADRIARGDYELRWRTERVAELNTLAHAFETMSGAIRRREDRIARSEARLRAMLDAASGLAVKWLDRAGRVIYWNPGAESLYGYNATEAIGRPLGQLAGYAAQRFDVTESIACLERGGGTIGPVEVEVRHRNGASAWVLTTLFALPGTEEERVFVSIDVDITARLRETQARTEAERKFSVVFHACPVAMEVCVIATDHAAADVNDAWTELFLIPRAQAIGRDGIDMRMWTDNQVRRRFMDQLDHTDGVGDFEAWMRRSDGEQRLCRVSGRRFQFGGEGLAVIVYEDITGHREAEARLRELNDALESKVIERTGALNRSNQELTATLEHLKRTQEELVRAEKMAALGSLVAGVAHELGTPLGNSLMAANTVADQARGLRRELEQGLRRSALERFLAETETGSAIIERNLQRAAELVASFKQIAVDQSSAQRRTFALTEVVEEIAMTMRPSFKRTPIRLITDTDADIVVDSFPGALGQILTNLVGNALIHAFEGRASGTIRIVVQAAEPGSALIEVRDDGRGIPPDHLRRIFDPFFTTRLGRGGTGLGLNIVHNLVTHVLGGTIGVESVPHEGTTVQIRIPCSAPERDSEGPDSDAQAPSAPPPPFPSDAGDWAGDGI